MRVRGENEQKAELIDKENLYIEPTMIDRRRKGKHRVKLTLSEKIQIIHQAVVSKLSHKDIA